MIKKGKKREKRMKMPIEPIGAGVIPTLNPSEHTLYPSKKS